MNLKDRMSSETQPSKSQERAQTMTSDSTTLKSNPQPQDSILQKQSETIQKQMKEIQQLTSTISEMQSQTDSIIQELDHLKKLGRPSDIEAIQILSSEKSELKSVIADLRAELSSVQKINQSLTRNNQSLTQSNDDLRNNAGLRSLKEQRQLEERCHTLMAGNADLKRMVNMSNVEAVQTAQAAQKAAEQKARQDILACEAEARGKVYTATLEKKSAIKDAKKRVQNAEKSRRTAWGSFIITLFCCLIVHPSCLLDIESFIYAPIMWIWNTLNIYAEWIQKPYYSKIIGNIEKSHPFSTGWAWILRILSLLILPVCILSICYGIHSLFQYYRKRWCQLSLKVLLGSTIIIIIFGEAIQEYVDINLILLFIIIQVAYLFALGCFDKYYESKYRTEDWERLQNA